MRSQYSSNQNRLQIAKIIGRDLKNIIRFVLKNLVKALVMNRPTTTNVSALPLHTRGQKRNKNTWHNSKNISGSAAKYALFSLL